jgi:hypothetical protein
VKPAVSSIFRGHSLVVTVTVTGKSGTPTGKVTLTCGKYTSAATSLSAGETKITIPANSLAASTDTLSVSYSGDAKYGPATGSAKVTVTQVAPTVTVKPGHTTIANTSPLSVTVTVTSTAGTPTGTVTLTSGSYASPKATLSGGKATISIPAGKLKAGTDTLTAKYEGGGDFKAATGSAKVKVTD